MYGSACICANICSENVFLSNTPPEDVGSRVGQAESAGFRDWIQGDQYVAETEIAVKQISRKCIRQRGSADRLAISFAGNGAITGRTL
jgi:hypothetical protein